MRQIVTLDIPYDELFEDPPADWSWDVGLELDRGTRIVSSEEPYDERQVSDG